ncbi:MAG: hypothetical protein DME26_16530 [Verrucomicrobia bacterium]|nr:MAG: hypothetical protein DME26_16530 [Verrucomicrobiota bacterium]
MTGLCQMLSPMLVFTTDEAWELVPGKETASVHETVLTPTGFSISETERTTWKELLALRELALPELEKARQSKQIGKALEAAVMFVGRDPRLESVELKLLPALSELLNVSDLDFCFAKESEHDLRVTVSHAEGKKCERCWHWEADVGTNPQHPTICGRCVAAVSAVVDRSA